jgi:hypothetical protein
MNLSVLENLWENNRRKVLVRTHDARGSHCSWAFPKRQEKRRASWSQEVSLPQSVLLLSHNPSYGIDRTQVALRKESTSTCCICEKLSKIPVESRPKSSTPLGYWFMHPHSAPSILEKLWDFCIQGIASREKGKTICVPTDSISSSSSSLCQNWLCLSDRLQPHNHQHI